LYRSNKVEVGFLFEIFNQAAVEKDKSLVSLPAPKAVLSQVQSAYWPEVKIDQLHQLKSAASAIGEVFQCAFSRQIHSLNEFPVLAESALKRGIGALGYSEIDSNLSSKQFIHALVNEEILNEGCLPQIDSFAEMASVVLRDFSTHLKKLQMQVDAYRASPALVDEALEGLTALVNVGNSKVNFSPYGVWLAVTEENWIKLAMLRGSFPVGFVLGDLPIVLYQEEQISRSPDFFEHESMHILISQMVVSGSNISSGTDVAGRLENVLRRGEHPGQQRINEF
jgi:hypothetical protein